MGFDQGERDTIIAAARRMQRNPVELGSFVMQQQAHHLLQRVAEIQQVLSEVLNGC